MIARARVRTASGTPFAYARRMRLGPRQVCLFVSLTLALSLLVGCTWRHAPGYAARAEMKKTRFPIITPQACFTGGCDLEGPGGKVDISIQEAATVGNRREDTAFEISYLGAKSACRGPAIGPDGTQVPFACSIHTPGASSRHVLVLDAGCTRGTLREVDPTREIRALRIETDLVDVGGHRSAGREVTLSDEHRVLAHSDAHASGVDLFSPRDRAAATPELLAMLSLHSFRELEGFPPQCAAP